MKRVFGVLLGVIALLLQCGCSKTSNPVAPVADGTAASVLPAAADERVAQVPSSEAGRRNPFVFEGGVRDDFAAPVEPTAPSAAFVRFAAADWPQRVSRWFDEHGTDEALIHTFTGWNFPVRGATLELHLRADGQFSENDSVRLGLVGGSNTVEAFRWWMTIHKVTRTWPNGAETTLRLDLANLPSYSTFPTNILSELQDGALELMVEDDTSVDYARLVLTPGGKDAKPVALQFPMSPSAR